MTETTVRRDVDGGPVRVTLAGEFDVADATLTDLDEELAGPRGVRVEVDAADVTFADSSFVRSLLRLRQHVLDRDGELVVVAMSWQLERVLHLTGVADLVAEGALQPACHA